MLTMKVDDTVVARDDTYKSTAAGGDVAMSTALSAMLDGYEMDRLDFCPEMRGAIVAVRVTRPGYPR